MATATVKHRPEMTVDAAMEIFGKHFAGKYKVCRTKSMPMRDFVVKKSGWTGVGVKLKHDKDSSIFVFTGMIPSLFKRLLFGGLITYLFLRPRWKAMESEIASFIQNAPEFKN